MKNALQMYIAAIEQHTNEWQGKTEKAAGKESIIMSGSERNGGLMYDNVHKA